MEEEIKEGCLLWCPYWGAGNDSSVFLFLFLDEEEAAAA